MKKIDVLFMLDSQYDSFSKLVNDVSKKVSISQSTAINLVARFLADGFININLCIMAMPMQRDDKWYFNQIFTSPQTNRPRQVLINELVDAFGLTLSKAKSMIKNWEELGYVSKFNEVYYYRINLVVKSRGIDEPPF